MPSVETQILLPQALVAAIEAQTGARIGHVVGRGGGGASRNGAEVTLANADGTTTHGYLAWDSRLSDPTRLPAFRREMAILGALTGRLAGCGVNAPPLIASHAPLLASMTGFVDGTDHWESLPDGPVKHAAAIDFVRQIAALHAIDARATPLDGFGDPRRATHDRLRESIAGLRATVLTGTPDAIFLLALDWLGDHVPPAAGPAVIVHGDAGPGNFLCRDGRTTALLDWELAHYGDPMEDLAAIWVRMLFKPFIPVRDIFAAYEAASGTRVALDRVLFYRLYFQLSFSVPGAAIANDPKAPPAAVGTTMMFAAVHRRVIVQQTAERMGVTLTPVQLPTAPFSERDRAFELALEDLREVIVPYIGDQRVAAKAKSLARMIKFWRQRDRCGAAFDAAEIAEVAAALNRPLSDVVQARRALAEAVAHGTIDPVLALQLCHARVTRETAVTGEALGWFRDTYFSPLE